MIRFIFLFTIFLSLTPVHAALLDDDDCNHEWTAKVHSLRVKPGRRLENKVTLQGEEITLVPISENDLPFLHDLDSTPGVRRDFGDRRFPNGQVLGELELRREQLSTKDRSRGDYFAGWIVKKNGQSAGYIQLTKGYVRALDKQIMQKIDRYLEKIQVTDRFVLTAGYVVHPRFRGQGIASQSLKQVLDFAVHRLGVELVLASIYSDNLASQSVVANNGFFPIHTEQPTFLDWYSSEDLN